MNTLLKSFLKFFRLQSASSTPLLVATGLALLLANSPLGTAYENFWRTSFTPGFAGFETLNPVRPLRFWINDGLMAVFFLVVGLEIKRELVGGELSGLRKAALPLLAALGGMICPAFLYIAFVGLTDASLIRGWGIPTVTDIAFALGALALLGDRVPYSLKIFLSALAIMDDLGAIFLIAVFYSGHLSSNWILTALAILAALGMFNRSGGKSILVYLSAGIFLWAAVLNSGLHPTLAGVLLSWTIPTHAIGKKSGQTVGHIPSDTEPEPEDLSVETPSQRMADWLQPWVSYAILPLFALCNAGVSLSDATGHGPPWWESPVFMAVTLGLLVGKPLGIAVFSWLAVRRHWAELPRDVSLPVLSGTGILGGIGFTMSLFIALLAFQRPADIIAAKAGILLASLLSGLLGIGALRSLLPQRPN